MRPPRKVPVRHGRTSGYMLAETLIYIAVSFLLLGVGYAVLHQCVENSVGLRKSADDISQTLQVGEIWRADVRAASGALRFRGTGPQQTLVMTGNGTEISYQATTNAVLRRIGNGPWIPVLNSVRSSLMESESRGAVTVWRWEIELQPRSRKQGQLKPLFTFMAVPEKSR